MFPKTGAFSISKPEARVPMGSWKKQDCTSWLSTSKTKKYLGNFQAESLVKLGWGSLDNMSIFTAGRNVNFETLKPLNSVIDASVLLVVLKETLSEA